MNRKNYSEKIAHALANGLARAPGQKADPGQALTFILSDKRYFHHATMNSAKAEKRFLEQALGKKIQLYKVWNIQRTALEKDMMMLRAELSKESNWNAVHKAIDRLVCGAGY